MDPELRALLTGGISVGSVQQAFPLLTVDATGFPYPSLISRAELRLSDDDAVLIAVRGATTRANLNRERRATLLAIGDDAAHYVTLELHESRAREPFEAFLMSPSGHRRDSLGIALTPISYKVTPELAEHESWRTVSELLDELAHAGM